MAKVKGICRNEDCIKLNEIQEVEKTEFTCPECGDPLIPFGGRDSDGGTFWKKHGKKVIIGAVVALLAGVGVGVSRLGGGDRKSPEKVDTLITPPVDTLKVTPVATPVATPNGGEYKNKVTVQLECATEGAVMYYTLDGTDPTPASAVYTDPIELKNNCTLKVIACKDDSNFTDSEILCIDYVITSESETVAGNGKRYQGTLNLSYGKYVGEIVNGKPDGAGVLTYTKAQKVVSTKDVMAEAGERIEGVFENGKASFVTLYKKNGNAIKVHR
ncbi:MAG: chitobiase/beta-hexosaminidase C-terminal domain-containing protein [Bacteroidaceae bacterium]|nr:chitobiase/beta-hexosaminidase C-terminal domain-containing protein [Bacteroidaceae bacterium]